MMIEKLRLFIKKRLYEGPTWAAIISLVTAFGLELTTEQVIAITGCLMILLPNKIDEL